MVNLKVKRIPGLRFANFLNRRITVVFACLIMALGIGLWASARSSDQTSKTTIVNKTKALEIVNTADVLMGQTHVLRVTLRNVSAKNIVSYTYLIGRASNTRGYALSETLFGPGQTSDEYISYENLQTASATPSDREADIVLAAVWFEEGTGDGDPKSIQQLKDESEGIRDQAAHILPLLRKAREGSAVQEDYLLNDLESKISLLPTDDKPKKSTDYIQGRSMANRQIALKVKHLRENKGKTSGINRKAEVTGNLVSWERLLSRF